MKSRTSTFTFLFSLFSLVLPIFSLPNPSYTLCHSHLYLPSLSPSLFSLSSPNFHHFHGQNLENLQNGKNFGNLENLENFVSEKIEIRFNGRVDRALRGLELSYRLSTLGIRIKEEKFDLCKPSSEVEIFGETWDEVRCEIPEGKEFEVKMYVEVDQEVPENVPIEVEIVAESEGVEIGCYQKTVMVRKQSKGDNGMVKSTRFGFTKDEVRFLFKKWYEQYKGEIFLPASETHFDLLGAASDRQEIFHDNLLKIAFHNAKSDKKYTMGMNHFGHLTSKEFKEIYANGFKPQTSIQQEESFVRPTFPKNLAKTRQAPKMNLRLDTDGFNFNRLFENFPGFRSLQFDADIEFGVRPLSEEKHLPVLRYARPQPKMKLPESVNWVHEGAVTPVKNQGSCGSCWSFATTGAIEGSYFLKHHKLVSFSEQQLVSCDHTDMGCDGGSMDQAFQWIEENEGLCREEDYPYTSGGDSVRGFCKNSECQKVPGSKVSSWVDVEHSDISLEEAVAGRPVAVAIEADEAAFQFYQSGILDTKCDNKVDHGVLIAGYGKDENGEGYWLVKNSWGPQWGMEGYVKILRGNKDNTDKDDEEYEGGECGILLGPSYPVLE